MHDGTQINGTSTSVVGYADLKKDDVILYYTEGGVTYIEKAASVTGTMTAFNAATVTISGTAYAVSGLKTSAGVASATHDDLTDDNSRLGVEGVVYYLDNGNNIIKATVPAANVTLDNIIFLTAVEKTTSLGVNTFRAAALSMDGVSSTIVVSKVANNGGTLNPVKSVYNSVGGTTSGAVGELKSNHFYTYTVNADGTYNLTYAANPLTGVSTDITASTAAFLSGSLTIGTTATRFIYQNVANGAIATYTGVSNVPAYDTNSGKVYVLNNASGYAMAVVALGGTPASGVTVSADKVFIVGAATTNYGTTGNYYTYPAYVNGEYTAAFATKNSLDAGKLYDVTAYEGDLAAMVTEATNKTAAVDDINYASGTLTVCTTGSTDTSYILADNVAVYLYNSKTTPVTASIINADAAAALDLTNNNAVVYLVQTSVTDMSIAAVYIAM